MAANPLEHFARLTYVHSSYGMHTSDRPTREWVGSPWAGAGEYVPWDGVGTIPADAMIEQLITLMLPLFKPAVAFTGYEIFSLLPGEDKPIVVYAKTLTGQVGTSADTSQDRAWERTYIFRTTGSWLSKICLLDTPCQGLVSRYATVTGGGADDDLIQAWMDNTNAWSGRADERPASFYGLTTQPNKALERKYGVN